MRGVLGLPLGRGKACCGALGMEFTRVTEFQHGRVFLVSKSRFYASLVANELISRIADVFLMQEAPGSCLFGLVEARGEVDLLE